MSSGQLYNISLDRDPLSNEKLKPPRHYDIVKVTLVGNTNVGKTALTNRLTYSGFNEQYMPTMCMDFSMLTLERMKIQFWDTAGQAKFISIGDSYYHNGHVTLLCFSVDNPQSFIDLHDWYQRVKRVNIETTFILVATKCDKTKHVTSGEIQQWRCDHPDVGKYIETSSLLNCGIGRLENYIVNSWLEMKSHEQTGVTISKRTRNTDSTSSNATIPRMYHEFGENSENESENDSENSGLGKKQHIESKAKCCTIL
jgi:small GTP-binding protein